METDRRSDSRRPESPINAVRQATDILRSIGPEIKDYALDEGELANEKSAFHTALAGLRMIVDYLANELELPENPEELVPHNLRKTESELKTE